MPNNSKAGVLLAMPRGFNEGLLSDRGMSNVSLTAPTKPLDRATLSR